MKVPKKHALIIGINTYAYMEPKYQLKGCVNDAKLINSVLVNKFNFDPKNIVLLLNEQATLRAIHKAMEHFAETLETDDVFVFHFSGHGGDCNVHTEFTDEGTGKDNCILPCDDSEIGTDGERIYREVRDKQFSDWLQRVAQKTLYTTLIFDACYSGTMTRSSEPSTNVRCISSQMRAGSRASVSTNAARVQHSLSSENVPRGAGGWLTLSDNYTVISGSRDTQKAKEWHFDIGGESVRHGLLSFFLARALIRAKPLSTYRDVFEVVCAGVVSMVTEQNPQIEGAIDREVFGLKIIEALDFIPVAKIDGNKLTLTGGAVHGLQQDSKWKLYPPGSKVAIEDECLGIIKITRVGGLLSSAEIVERRSEIVEGSRCIEFEAVPSVEPFNVNMEDLPEPYKSDFTRKLEQSKLLKAVDSSKGAQVKIHVCYSQAQLTEFLPDAPNHADVFPVWAVVEQQDQICMPLRGANEPNALDIVYSNLEKMAKFRNVLQLQNQRSELAVESNLYRLQRDGNAKLANGGTSEFAENELMSIELKNNEAEKSVFFTILWLGADRQIMHFYPRNRSCEELSAQRTIRIGSLENGLWASLPDNHISDVGSITWKIIFSSVKSDFGLLSQEGLRSSGNASNLDAFDIAFTGEAKPSHTERTNSQLLVEPDWCAINRGFILKKAEQ
jgi:hypothetical protein